MISEEQMAELKSMGDTLVDKLIEFYEATTGDPSDDFVSSLKLTLAKINEDLRKLRGNEFGQVDELELNVLNREDKVFERIMSLFKESDRILAAIKPKGGNAAKADEMSGARPTLF